MIHFARLKVNSQSILSMKSIFAAAFLTLSLASASVREVVTVFQPLSFHGTDTAEPSGEELVQAGIRSLPMVLSGAMPETLVDAVAHTHALSSIGEYPFKENNLIVLSGIRMSGEVEEKKLIVKIDLSNLKIPEEVDLAAREIIVMAKTALRKTLAEYHSGDGSAVSYEVRISGTSEKNATLKDLAEKVVLKK